MNEKAYVLEEVNIIKKWICAIKIGGGKKEKVEDGSFNVRLRLELQWNEIGKEANF